MTNKYDKILDEYREDDSTTSVVSWGSITGTLANQTDLQNALNAKASTTAYTLAGVSLISTTTSRSLYSMTSAVPVEFQSSNGTTLLKIDETNKQTIHNIGSAAVPSITFTGFTATGLYGVSTTQFGLIANSIKFTRSDGTYAAEWSSSGSQVTIGTTGAINFAFKTNDTERGRFAVTTGNLLIGGLTTDGTGVLQFPVATTSAGGIGLGADTWWYRSSAGNTSQDSASASSFRLRTTNSSTNFTMSVGDNTSAKLVTSGFSNGVNMTVGTEHNGSLIFETNTTTALTLDASQDALFAPTNRVRITGTKVLSFGVTADATIGVSADTTSGSLAITGTSSGNVVINSQSGNLQLTQGRLRLTDGTQGLDRPAVNALSIIAGSGGTTVLTFSATVGTITGGPQNMILVAGTGNSRTMALQTTTSGGTATTALTLNADQSATFANTVNATTFVGALTGNASTATALQNARTIGGTSFDGTANITVATATGGFTVSGGNLALGANSITMSGSIGVTLTRVTKGWFSDLEVTNMPTVNGTAVLTSLTAPQFTTIELGAASDTTLARVSAGVISVEGVRVITDASTTSGKILKNNGTTFVASTETYAAPGTSGNVMTSDGTNWTSAAAAGGSTTPTVIISTTFETAGRFTDTVNGGGQTSYGANGLVIAASATGTSSSQTTWALQARVFDRSPTFAIQLICNPLSDTAGTGSAFFGLGTPTVSGSGTTWTDNHIGFKIIRTGGVFSLYATQAGGTETASAALTTLSNGDRLDLILKVNGTASVDYYWSKNGAALSSATNLATNVPTAFSANVSFSVSNDATAHDMGFLIAGSSYQR